MMFKVFARSDCNRYAHFLAKEKEQKKIVGMTTLLGGKGWLNNF